MKVPSRIVVEIPGVLFVMVQPVYTCTDGHEQVTFHAFTAEGIRSRTARTFKSREGWAWLCSHATGEPGPWSQPFPLDGETIEQLRAWHEREHAWTLIPHLNETHAFREAV